MAAVATAISGATASEGAAAPPMLNVKACAAAPSARAIASRPLHCLPRSRPRDTASTASKAMAAARNARSRLSSGIKAGPLSAPEL